MGAETRRIVLDVETVADSLTGRISTSDGRTREFTGWLGLLGALQTLLPRTDTSAEEAPR